MTLSILLREIALLALLTGIGAAPAAWLPRACDASVRVALAPAFGLAVAVCVLTTANFAVPLAGALWWALVPLAGASLALAARRRPRQRPPALPLLALALAGAVVLGSASYPLLQRDSFGPLGYGIFDGPGYTAYAEGYQSNTNARPLGITRPDWAQVGDEAGAWGETWDLLARYGWGYRWQHTTSDTVLAAISGGLGWPPWTLIAPFMAVALAIGAAGVFATIRILVPGATLTAALGAALFGGPLLFQVYLDGSQGLLAGLAVVPATLTLTVLALQRLSWRRTGLLGLLLAGLQTLYPELTPLAALSGGLVLAGAAVARRGSLSRGSVAVAARHVAALVALALLLSPRASVWTLSYLADQLSSEALLDTLVDYDLAPGQVPGWLAQTREFYAFAFPGGDPGSVVWRWLVPLGAAGLAVYAVARQALSLVLVAVVAAAAAQALTASSSLDCSYCAQRTLLSLAPVVPVLVLTGAALAWRRHAVAGRVVAIAVVALLLAGAGGTLVTSQERAIDATYLPAPDLSEVAERARELPAGTLALEGLDATRLWSWADLPTTYGALRHDSDRRLSVVAAYNDNGGFSYLNTRPEGHPAYTPDYRWVLSRFGQIDTGRRVVARIGPYRLAERAGEFDVLPARGLAVDPANLDRAGQAWVQAPGAELGLQQGPLTFWVSALGERRAFLRLRLQGAPGASLTAPGVRQRSDPSGRLDACVPVPGTGATRIVTAELSPPGPSFAPSTNRFGNPPLAGKGVELQRLRASADPCARR